MKSTAQRDRDAFWKAKAKSEKQRARMRSFWVPAWLSELVSWEKIGEDYRRAKELLSLGDNSNLKTWIQTTCAEPWVEEQPPTIRGNELLSRAEAYDAEMPAIWKHGKSNNERVPLLLGATSLGKDLLINRLEIPLAGPGFIHIGGPERGFDEGGLKK